MKQINQKGITRNSLVGQWLRLLIALTLIVVLFVIFAESSPPGGTLGSVARNNMETNIDATPLFYSEVENIYEIQIALDEMLETKQVK